MSARFFAACLFLLPLHGIADAADRPVVLELFTSQGCSSCPPADALLTELARERKDVLPLAFHVTYWNYLGWSDPFSLQAATQRQADYSARFGDGSYTPEMVVDGRAGVVGSDRSAVEAAIASARRTAAAVPLTASRNGSKLSIEIGRGAGQGRVFLVGYDIERRTPVRRGENGGRTLLESNIVRSFAQVGEWNGVARTIDAGIPAAEAVAVLVQAPDGRIIGAVRVAPAS